MEYQLTPEQFAGRMTRYAILAAQPRPVIGVVDCRQFGDVKQFATPEEFRSRLWATVGQGIKGLLWRQQAANKNDPLTSEFQQFLRQIARIREELSIADSVLWASVNDPKRADAYMLLCGNKSAIVVVVMHYSTKGPTETQDAVRVTVNCPTWVHPKAMSELMPDGTNREISVLPALTWDVPGACLTSLYRIEF